MPNVIVTMYKDSGANVYPSGVVKSVSTSSEIFSSERVYTENLEQYACSDNPIPYLVCLKIKDPVLGEIWIGDDEISFTSKISQAIDGPTGGDIVTVTLLVGTDIAAGNTLTADWLHGAKIIGDPVLSNTPLSNIPFNPDYSATQGQLDFTSSPLIVGAYLTIVYQKP